MVRSTIAASLLSSPAVQYDRATMRTQSIHSAKRVHRSASIPPRRRMTPAAESSRRCPIRAPPPPYRRPRPLPILRKIRPARGSSHADCAPDGTPSSRSTNPWRTHHNSSCPEPPPPQPPCAPPPCSRKAELVAQNLRSRRRAHPRVDITSLIATGTPPSGGNVLPLAAMRSMAIAFSRARSSRA